MLSISATKLGYSRAASYYEYLANSKFAIRCEYVGYKIEVVSSPCSHWRRTGYLIPTTISQPYPISVYDRHDNLRTYLDEQVKAILINIGVEKDVSDPVITFQRMLGERETGILTSSQLQALNDLLIALKIEQQYGFQTEDYQN